MTIDKAQLKALAEAANAVTTDVNITMAVGSAPEEVKAVQDFLQQAMPKTILALLAEIEGLHAQHGRDSGELRKLCSARDSARRQRDQLKAENQMLRDEDLKWQGLREQEGEIERLKAENEALRKQVSNLSPFNSFPKQTVTGSNRCLACGEYHHGLGNLPCPKMTPVAQANLAKEPQA